MTRPMFVIRSGRLFTTYRCRPSVHNSLSTRQPLQRPAKTAGAPHEAVAITPVRCNYAQRDEGLGEQPGLGWTHIARRFVWCEAIAVVNHAAHEEAERVVPEPLGQGVGRFSRDVGRERQIRTGERRTQTSAGKQAERIPRRRRRTPESRRPCRHNALHVARGRTSGHDYCRDAMPARELGPVSIARSSHATLRLNGGLRNSMPIRPPETPLLLLPAVIYAAERSAWSCHSRSASWFQLAKVRGHQHSLVSRQRFTVATHSNPKRDIEPPGPLESRLAAAGPIGWTAPALSQGG